MPEQPVDPTPPSAEPLQSADSLQSSPLTDSSGLPSQASPRTPPAHEPPAPLAVSVAKRGRAFSLVWIVPLLAALAGAWLLWQHVVAQGPTISIAFKNAEGLEANKTKVRYKEVDIGTVTAISIARDRSHVIVTARINRQADNLITADARFWVVRPRISVNTISGLGTLLSGAYIGVDAGKSQDSGSEFTGLETPPPVTFDSPGRLYRLHADNIGSLYIGAPAYFRRVAVGNVTGYVLDADGRGVTLEIFVNSPYDRLVTSNVRFWHASGIDATFDGGGLKLNTESVISVLVGGIAFEPLPDSAPTPPSGANTNFRLYANRATALNSVSEQVDTYLLYFKESLRGLAVGATVDFHGIVIGEVKAVSLEYDREEKTLRFPVEIAIYPDRLRSRYRPGGTQMSAMERDPQVLLDRLVARGFRAQLKSGNLLTGQLFVALDLYPKAAPAKIDWSHKPVVLPTIPAPLESIQETLANIAAKLDKVPFDSIGNNLNSTLKTLNQTLKTADSALGQLNAGVLPELKGTLAEARQAIGSAQLLLSPDAPVQNNLQDTLKEVGRAAQALRVLADYLGRHPESLIRGKKEEK